ncbi:hypothetical protein [Dyadobacter bucti]|uniref:hypothetical protein n=1 Tax=Dyadobacter bucti TaxID=2572203 RepID=UPI001E5F7AA0|nr:hypothetical protein [Dyadobacter bucti]
MCALKLLPRLITSAALRQIAAHSKSSWMHFARCPTFSSFKHSVAQWLQAIAHATQASIHSLNC